jgi:DNA-binding transcriptional LysR family regulator
LTSEGEEFINAIRPLLAEAEHLENKYKGKTKTDDAAPLIVGGSHNVSANVLPKLLMAFKTRQPSTQVILETNESPVIEKRLLASEVEIALITNPSYRAELVYEPYGDMELVAFCLPSNPLARKKLSLKELGECSLVLRRGGRLEKVLMNLGYKMNIALRCDVSGAVKAAVRMGMGVGILYSNAVASRVARGNLRLINVPELKQLGIKSFITYDRRKPLGTMAQEFLQILRDQKNPPMAANDRGVHIGNARRLALH